MHYVFTREQLVAAFDAWNKQAAKGGWPFCDDPESSADHLLQLLPVPAVAVHPDMDVVAWLAMKGRVAADNGQTEIARLFEIAADDIANHLHVGPEDHVKALNEIIQMIGEANVNAGWWSDANIDLRNFPYTVHVVLGKLALVNTEVSEACEGWRKSQKGTLLMDDHLPHRNMMEVEIADAVIRLFDLSANVQFPNGTKLDVAGALLEKLAYNAVRPDHKIENREKEGGKAA